MKSFLMPQRKGQNHQLPQILAILASSLAGVSSGMLFSWTSPSIPQLLDDDSMAISFEAASYFTVIQPIAMLITAPLFSMLIDAIGRKQGVLLVAVPQLLAWILTAYAKNIWVFYAARFVTGVGDAAIFASTPIYVCEISQPKVRGVWGNMVAISIYLGIFLINVIGAYNDIWTTALIGGSISLVHLAIFAFMPESPYYLLIKDQEDKATEALKLLRWRQDVEDELRSLKDDVKRQVSERGTMKELFTIDSNRKALLMCCIIRFGQQFSGLPAFEMYTQYMFQQAGGNLSDKASAIIFSGILVLCISLASFIVEKFGRRPLTIFSCFSCGVVLTVETVYFSIVQFTNLDVSGLGWLPLGGMITYIVVCSTGIGILPTLIAGEIFSASIKSKATSVMNIALAACFIIVPKLFQTLTHNFGIFAPFGFFSFCCFAIGILSCFYVAETKGKTLEEIQQELKGKKVERNYIEKDISRDY